MSRPEVPSLEVFPREGFVMVIPQVSKVFLDRPRTADPQVFGSDRVELLSSPNGDVLLAPQPQILGPLQYLFAPLRELLVFALSDLVHSLKHMAHYMKTIKYDLPSSFRNIGLCGRDIGIPHIHGYRFNTFKLLLLNCR
jgi:hypothetical protein